ncbi:MAG: endonuclease/exonuclease/phosphatase family protein [Planctomycetaceae bacterium]|jgi:endonuclease/exonuclease/phosphatase family metal-dependent hydrolase|nr:endonuclease/exonuclease/phosphatase family protein [Planctomycetaceae bacterium]
MRVLSYNIHKGIGGRDRLYKLQRIIDVIEHEKPDIICLQEVDRNVSRSNHDDQPLLISDYFNFAHRMYRMNVHLQEGGYGNLMLSRWPFLTRHEVSLQKGERKARSAQIAVIDSPEGAVRLVNYHLGLAETERQWQVEHLLNHRLYREAKDTPTLIIGDTNDWRGTLKTKPFETSHFQEVTEPSTNYRSFPAYLPIGSLDKAFCCHCIEIHEARIVKNRISKDASDHLPLVIDFHLKTGGH